MVKITLSTDPKIEFDIAENSTEETVAEALAANKNAVEYAVKIARDSGYNRYYSDGYSSFAESTLRDITNAYLSGDEGLEYLTELLERDEYDHYYEYVRKPILKDLLNELSDAFYDDDLRFDIEDIVEQFLEEIKDDLFEAMCEKDESSFTDAIHHHETIEVSFIPHANLLSFDDLQTDYVSVCSGPETIYPNANFMRALQFFNISPSEFVSEAKQRGIDLLNPSTEHLSEFGQEGLFNLAHRWAAILDIEKGNTDYVKSLRLSDKYDYDIKDWNKVVDIVRYAKDFDRPAALSMDDLFTVLTEATQGGNPTFACRVSVRDILNGLLDKPFLAKGGFTGIHNYSNGSGYIEVTSNEILIDPAKGRWATKFGRYTVDEVYGMVSKYYNISTTPYQEPTLQRVKNNLWLSKPGEQMATVTRNISNDGIEEFLVHTYDNDMEPNGPREIPEHFSSLEEALADATAQINSEWRPSVRP